MSSKGNDNGSSKGGRLKRVTLSEIAEKAGVPIGLGYLDYKTKTGSIGKLLYPSGDFDRHFKIIQDFYKDKTAKHPEKFNLSPIYRNEGLQK